MALEGDLRRRRGVDGRAASRPAVPVKVHEQKLAEDLSNASKAGRTAIEIERLRADGIPQGLVRDPVMPNFV